jgi:opacity protein-like surface antigen
LQSTLCLLALAATGLLSLPVIANAQATEGAFINGNLGSASVDSGLLDGNDTSYGVNAGYRWRVSPGTLIGFEAGYVDLGRYSALTTITFIHLAGIGGPPADPEIEIVPASLSTKTSGWTIGAYGRFSLSPNWYIGGRAGFIRASVNSRLRYTRLDDSVGDDRRTYDADGWYVGAGFGYDLSNNFSLGLNYDYYSVKKHFFKINPGVVSVSGEYRF